MKKTLLALTLVLCLCTTPARAAFSDVPAGQYYSEAVAWAAAQSIAGGENGAFSPDAPCTTAQILTFLWRAKGCPAPAAGPNPFSDAGETDYFYEAALWAREQGLVSGGALSPNAPCTRAQTVTYLWRLAGQPESEAKALAAGEGETRICGVLGDTLVNCFFSYTVRDAVLTDTAEGAPAGEGTALLAVDVTVENVHHRTIPMYDTDFQLQWGEQGFGYPSSASTLPAEYELTPGESVSGRLVYQVPAESRSFALAVREFFDDGSAGSTFSCCFAVEDGRAVPGSLFADVPPEADCAPAVLWAVREGIASGMGDGFEPAGVCTRGQIVTLLYRAYGSREEVSGG